MKPKISIGGQALIEGVMMRSNKWYAMAVRRPDKKITIKKIKVDDGGILSKIPVVRGCYRLIETLVIGIRGLSFSASESGGEEEKLSTSELVYTLLFSIGMTILLFYLAPLLVARLFTDNRGFLFNLIDGILRIVIFFAYLFAISLLPDIRRIFQYHGAEHMTVHAYEHGEKLTVKNIRKYSTLHPRCGTNFILIVILLSVLVFSFLPVNNFLERFLYRLLLFPVIAGIAYEFLRLGGKFSENPLVKVLILPGILSQKITTKDPEDDMIEIAIKSLNAALSKK